MLSYTFKAPIKDHYLKQRPPGMMHEEYGRWFQWKSYAIHVHIYRLKQVHGCVVLCFVLCCIIVHGKFIWLNGPLTRYVKLWVAHAPGMLGMFSPPSRVSDPDKHHGTCVKHVPGFMSGSLNNGFLWSWRRGIRSRHSRRKRNPQFYVSGKRPILRITRLVI